MSTISELDLKTRRSLLSRLRDLDDRESWRTFFDLYWRMLYNVARRAGLADADAQDVVQETVVAVARQMPEFRYDRAKGTFKHWLFRIVRRRVADHLRRVYRQPPMGELAFDPLAEDDESAAVVPEDTTGEFGTAWEQEWEQAVLDTAVARVREQANPKHFQVFDYCVKQGWPAGKVAATLGMNIAQVYLARHRVSHAVKAAARVINEERLHGGITTAAGPPQVPG
jgi:RNA polymerase sigma-70 factor (ECF subfamily)